MKKAVYDYNKIKPATNVLFHIILAALALACVIPLILVISISFSPESAIREYGYTLFPRDWTLEGYQFLFRQRALILRAFGMSVFVTVVGTLLGGLLTTLMGYVLSRREFMANKFLMWLVFIPMIFNGGLVSTFFIVGQFLQLRDTAWALILPLAVSSFNVIVCRTFFRLTIPDELLESAKIDGAGQFTIFFRLVMPLSLPLLATIGLFLSFAYWNDWFQALLYIDNQALFTLQAFLNQLLADINALAQNAQRLGLTQAQLLATMPREAARMAIVVVVVLPILCTYPFFQRYFISGLTLGAIKG